MGGLRHTPSRFAPTEKGITAGTTQTQAGGRLLTADVNEISICATTNDAVVLPLAVPGRRIVIINNGAETCQIFPGVGDDLGSGADASTTLTSGSNIIFMAYSIDDWEII